MGGMVLVTWNTCMLMVWIDFGMTHRHCCPHHVLYKNWPTCNASPCCNTSFNSTYFAETKVTYFMEVCKNHIPHCVFRIGRQSKRQTHSMSLKVVLFIHQYAPYTPYTHTSSNRLLRSVHPVSTGGLFKQRSQVGMGLGLALGENTRRFTTWNGDSQYSSNL